MKDALVLVKGFVPGFQGYDSAESSVASNKLLLRFISLELERLHVFFESWSGDIKAAVDIVPRIEVFQGELSSLKGVDFGLSKELASAVLELDGKVLSCLSNAVAVMVEPDVNDKVIVGVEGDVRALLVLLKQRQDLIDKNKGGK